MTKFAIHQYPHYFNTSRLSFKATLLVLNLVEANKSSAKGGKPLTAMNVVCFPTKLLDISVLKDVLRGGIDKMSEAGVLLVGGHSIDDAELKYGLSVTGTVHPKYGQREELVDGFIFCMRTLGYVNAPALMQRIVRHLQHITVSVAEYQKKRDFLYGHLIEMGYSVIKPQGAFYMFPKSPLEDDIAFVRYLQQSKVLTVPGRGFGSPGYFRISYCVDDRTLQGSLDGFRKATQKFNIR